MTGEPGFIAALRTMAPHPAARGLADDAAVLELGAVELVLTHDMMVEGVHWLRGQDMTDIAFKLVAVNLSDLAAKGAEPLGVLLGFMLGENDAQFLHGLEQALAEFGVPLLGGDTVGGGGGGARAIGLTAIGRATCHPVPSRSGAQPGDGVWLTGTIGAAMLGFEALRDADEWGETAAADTRAFRRPCPRLREGQMIAPLATAMMDVSDGLLLDASRMADASGVTIALDSIAIPFAERLPLDRRRDALGWGDDYELLFTAPETFAPPCPVTRIGTVLPRREVPLLLDDAPVEGRLGYQHGA
ncbi:thiamine-phosphate kinase [Novosphingobium lentum]|uniref:thiamine-phosphate kinase n=1 Tax=Novosphingobium lentum TaxID=145287 RepID=UPI00082BFFB4|nr:thiamine-phosphate kinase [Novosphingobium lentum]